MEIRITSGTYNTSSYRVKMYKNKKSAMNYLKGIGYAYESLANISWSFVGTNYKLSIN
jgi:hypothetical protein